MGCRMGITDTIDNKRKRSKSVKKEKKAINGKMDDIEDATSAAKEQLLLIGQYFWKRYIAGEYVPDENNKAYFDNLDALNDRVRDLNNEIDDLKIAGIKEREIIDEDTRIKIGLKEDRKAERAAAREERRNEKAVAKARSKSEEEEQ